MNWLVMAVLLLGSAILQAVLPALPALGQAKPPALAAVVVYYALTRRRCDWLTAAIGGGLIQDGMGLIPFGYSSFAFCLLGATVVRFKDAVFVHDWLTHSLFGAWLALGSTFVLYVLLTSTGLIDIPMAQAFHKGVGAGLLGMVLTPWIAQGCGRLDQLMGLVESDDSSWRELR